MTPCTHSDSGCNHPESQCAGLCTKPKLRYFPRPKPDIDLTELDGEPISVGELAMNTFHLYRAAGRGRIESFKAALQVYRSKS